MKKLLLAILIGAAAGFGASATSKVVAKGGGPCGPNGLVCGENQICCMSPHPFTYRCTAPNKCPYNN